MATIDPIRFGDVAVMLGDGADPEVFEAPCGITNISRTTTAQTQDDDLPDCDNPDAPGYNSPTVISTGDQITVNGFVDGDSHTVWEDWIRSGGTKNVRMVYTKGENATGGRRGYYQGPAVITNREEAYERRRPGRINCTIAYQAPPAWTPLVTP